MYIREKKIKIKRHRCKRHRRRKIPLFHFSGPGLVSQNKTHFLRLLQAHFELQKKCKRNLPRKRRLNFFILGRYFLGSKINIKR